MRIAPFFEALALPLFFLLFSCAGSPNAYREIDAEVSAASYDAALRAMEKSGVRNSVYTNKNAILYYLDRGMIRHYAEYWEESSRDLQEAERLIEAAFTRSISQEIGSYIANDNAKDYSGEDYEDLYINVFNALNYYHRNDMEGALVEIRRVNEKLRYLSGKYERASEKIISSNADLSNPEYAVEAVRFSNSALAQYLGMLFFRGIGNYDSARISLEELYQAYQLAPAVYNHAPPSSLEAELSIPQGFARLNVIGFAGLSPVKVEVNAMIPLPLPYPNNWARLALPQMIDRPSAVQSIEVILDDGQSFRLELLENMSRVVRETFKANYSLIILKTVARTIAKSVTGAAVSSRVSESNEDWGFLLGLIGRVAADLSEQADTRVSRYFPGYAYAGGINLIPGVYTVTVRYYGRSGLIYSERRSNVMVSSGSLNLLEFVCLK
ncbi:MAG: hypothetical protein LBI14_08740 [Treponema sp.]|nr:hypothetical protein [Treponema sp.]